MPPRARRRALSRGTSRLNAPAGSGPSTSTASAPADVAWALHGVLRQGRARQQHRVARRRHSRLPGRGRRPRWRFADRRARGRRSPSRRVRRRAGRRPRTAREARPGRTRGRSGRRAARRRRRPSRRRRAARARDVPVAGPARPSFPRGTIVSASRSAAPAIPRASGPSANAAYGSTIPMQRDPRRVLRVAVVVRIDRCLEPGQDLIRPRVHAGAALGVRAASRRRESAGSRLPEADPGASRPAPPSRR